jgi:hypothetical protein
VLLPVGQLEPLGQAKGIGGGGDQGHHAGQAKAIGPA